MTNYMQGIFIPKNPEKIMGKSKIQYRSGWEYTVMSLLDSHPNVLRWASESISIPYVNPLTGKRTVYIPDFLVVYKDKTGRERAEIIEVKPKKEAIAENARSKKDKAALLLNTAKWAALAAYCKKHGYTWRILTEDQIYITKGKGLKGRI